MSDVYIIIKNANNWNGIQYQIFLYQTSLEWPCYWDFSGVVAVEI